MAKYDENPQSEQLTLDQGKLMIDALEPLIRYLNHDSEMEQHYDDPDFPSYHQTEHFLLDGTKGLVGVTLDRFALPENPDGSGAVSINTVYEVRHIFGLLGESGEVPISQETIYTLTRTQRGDEVTQDTGYKVVFSSRDPKTGEFIPFDQDTALKELMGEYASLIRQKDAGDSSRELAEKLTVARARVDELIQFESTVEGGALNTLTPQRVIEVCELLREINPEEDAISRLG